MLPSQKTANAASENLLGHIMTSLSNQQELQGHHDILERVIMAYSKELSIGNRILDSEHKKMHGMIDRIACSIAARDIAALSEALELLEDCLCAYFAVEENIAQSINLDFTQHKLAHQHLLNEFQRIKGKLTAKNGMWSDDEGEGYAHSLMNYLIGHIKEDSGQLKIVLDTCLYDFNP